MMTKEQMRIENMDARSKSSSNFTTEDHLAKMRDFCALECMYLMAQGNVGVAEIDAAVVYARAGQDYADKLFDIEATERNLEEMDREAELQTSSTPLPAPQDDSFRVTVNEQINAVQKLSAPSILPSMGPRG